MSQKLISHSPDLKKLRDNGYNIEIREGFLCVSDIPYVNERKEIAQGMLISSLELSGDITTKPEDHTVHFCGEYPCNANGSPIESIRHSSGENMLTSELTVNHIFSSKPPNGYSDYYEKITAYVQIIEHQAQAMDSSVTAKTYRSIKGGEDDPVFFYTDTNSSRSEIVLISEKLKDMKIGIVGLGGTGSYVLDFVSKTHVKEIHLFDDDELLQHNAFRMPGSSAFGVLDGEKITKVEHLHKEYSKMRRGVVPHQRSVTGETMEDVLKMDFIFLCIDIGSTKKQVIQKLKEISIPCIDVGMGIDKIDMSLKGIVRTTAIADKSNHYFENISFEEARDDEYNGGIQIAEINALNAALAVVKWKKMCGFYCNQIDEYESLYDISMNKIVNKIKNETEI